ncbi:hypothetical protein [Priestia sp. GS2]|uniref:hypothetical protein n=1 Tax=Priestia sp. GS2 TaxID=3117403 RepID=UPI002ED9E618
MKKPFSKKKDAYQRNFIKLPSDLSHYINHRKVKAEMFYLYALIIDYYNEDEFGYAFPNKDTLALKYGKTTRTTGDHLSILRDIGLIEIIEGTIHGNAYVPYEPLTSEEFYERYPDAWDNYLESLRKLEESRKQASARMARYRDKD